MHTKNVIIGAKDIIKQTKLSDSTVRRILKKLLQDKNFKSHNSYGNMAFMQI